jgi:hypothetical protein
MFDALELRVRQLPNLVIATIGTVQIHPGCQQTQFVGIG